MKLNEIIDLTRTKKVINTHATDKFRDDDFEILGDGLQAIVYQETNKPNIVKILFNKPSSNNAYLKYIQACAETANHNPFLPRIGNIVEFEMSEEEIRYLQMNAKVFLPADFSVGMKSYVFKMEKLISIQMLDDAELESLLSSTYKEKVLSNTRLLDTTRDVLLRQDETAGRMVVDIGMLIKNPTASISSKFNMEDQIKEACQLINKVLVENKAQEDLTQNNIMARRTNVGLQLVITDPLY